MPGALDGRQQMTAVGLEERTDARPGILETSERGLAISAISLMSLLPVAELVSRQLGLRGLPGSSLFVQHLTLWVAFLGAGLTVASNRLLSLSANTLLPRKW